MDDMIIAGIDVGNGYTKGIVCTGADGKKIGIDIPSCIAYMLDMHNIKINTFEEIEKSIQNIYDEADLSFVSHAIPDTRRVLLGRRAIRSKMTPVEFDVNSPESKAQDTLSYILVLGCLACKALQDYWNEHKSLPVNTYKATAHIALALPINEYKSYQKIYADVFLNGEHTVTIHNFEQPVNIQLSIQDVQILAEGASAQFAIDFLGKPLMDNMLADLRLHGNPLKGITSDDILAAKNTVGIDIGEGTVNFPIFSNGQFNPDASVTFNKGYGSVLVDVLERLHNVGLPFASRKDLSEFLQQPPNALIKNRYNKVNAIIQEAVNAFVIEIGMQFSKILKQTGSFLELVYVYGGGAGAIKDALYPILIDEAARFGGEDMAYPVLYLDSRYSRVLNREGLFLVAHTKIKNQTLNSRED